MTAVSLPARVLADPIDAVPAAVESRRFAVPLGLLIATSVLAAVSFGLRWDGSAEVLSAIYEAGELSRTTEQDLLDRVRTTQRLALVTGVLGALFVTPVAVLSLAGLVKLVAWLLDRKVAFRAALALTAFALLPVALHQLIVALATFRQEAVTRETFAALVPSNLLALVTPATANLKPLYAAVDFFRLWSALLFGLGLAAASGLRRRAAVPLALVLYAVAACAMAGLSAGSAR
jgi:hypothetical protein